jgi:hypothetical protein
MLCWVTEELWERREDHRTRRRHGHVTAQRCDAQRERGRSADDHADPFSRDAGRGDSRGLVEKARRAWVDRKHRRLGHWRLRGRCFRRHGHGKNTPAPAPERLARVLAASSALRRLISHGDPRDDRIVDPATDRKPVPMRPC